MSQNGTIPGPFPDSRTGTVYIPSAVSEDSDSGWIGWVTEQCKVGKRVHVVLKDGQPFATKEEALQAAENKKNQLIRSLPRVS